MNLSMGDMKLNSSESKQLNSTEVMMAAYVAEQTILAILLFIGLYLSIANYLYLTKYTQRKTKISAVLTLLATVLFTAYTIWIELTSNQVVTQLLCQLDMFVPLGLANASKALIYAVIWRRQRLISTRRSMSTPTSRKINLFSYFILAGIVLFPVGIVITHISAPDCAIITTMRVAVLSILYLGHTLFEIMLLILIIYPILQHIASVKLNKSSALENIVKRLSLSSTFVVLTDVAFLVLAILRPAGITDNFISICAGLNLALNLIGLNTTYTDYQLHFFPCGKSCISKSPNSTVKECSNQQTLRQIDPSKNNIGGNASKSQISGTKDSASTKQTPLHEDSIVKSNGNESVVCTSVVTMTVVQQNDVIEQDV